MPAARRWPTPNCSNSCKAEALDVTCRAASAAQGGLHPVSLTLERIEAIFGSMGFDVAEGPEIETDWFSFTALNNPPNHPARSMQDTFYVDMQGRTALPTTCARTPARCRSVMRVPMSRSTAVIGCRPAHARDPRDCPGRTYRVDSDATHSPMFHQCEGLWIGENVSFKDLKVVFTDFCRTFFESDDLVLRFRPSFFPFTEPSAEIDIQFQSGPLAGRWLEVAGSGQVHPTWCATWGWTPSATSALPLAWARTA
jgi:phenylalanyl-tRNA synthetase alpha chain